MPDVTEPELADSLMTPLQIAVFAGGERISAWSRIRPDGSAGPLTINRTMTVQALTLGIAETEDGPIKHVPVPGWSAAELQEDTGDHDSA